jgi:hypothetical protein
MSAQIISMLLLMVSEAEADLSTIPTSTIDNNSFNSQQSIVKTTASFSNSTSASIPALNSTITAPPASFQTSQCTFKDTASVGYAVYELLNYLPECASVYSSSLGKEICAWKSSLLENKSAPETMETTTGTIEKRTLITDPGVLPQSLLTTHYSTWLYQYSETLYMDQYITSVISKNFTILPGEIAKQVPDEDCCIYQCWVQGGDVRVFFWPTPALTPPVTELIDDQGSTL